MERWTFNSLLFSRLSDVLDISVTEIAKRVGIRQQVLNRYTKCQNDLPVKILIKMCNALRMPIYYFVSENNSHEIPNREVATIAADHWQPIDWDHQAVEHTFGDGEGRIYWKDVAAVMGVTAQKPHDRFLLRKRFTVRDFLAVCNHFVLSPFDFLVDQNRKGFSVKKKTGRADSPTLLADITALRRQVSDLTTKYTDLNTKYDDMLSKYDNLLNAHKSLLERFDEHIRDSWTGIAAEPGPKM